MKVNFSVDYSYLALISIQKECEKVIQKFNNEKDRIFLNTFFCKTLQKLETQEHDFEKDLFKFLKEEIKLSEGTITLDMLNQFAEYTVHEYMQNDEVKTKLNYSGYVKNKETGEIKGCNFGEHWSIIESMLEDKFGKYITYEPERFKEADAWIAKTIELYGNYDIYEGYTLANKRRNLLKK